MFHNTPLRDYRPLKDKYFMIKKILFPFVLLIVFNLSVNAQENWTTFTKTTDIDTLTAIEFDGDFIWLGMSTGIGLYDTLTGKVTDYPWSDSNIVNIVQDIAFDNDGTNGLPLIMVYGRLKIVV